jgi:hypothetical protein
MKDTPNIATIKKAIAQILKKHSIRKASLFGSIVKGSFTQHSDIDVLVEFPETYSLLDTLGVKIDLEEHLGRPVDLVQYKSIKPFAKKDILSTQVPIYPHHT